MNLRDDTDGLTVCVATCLRYFFVHRGVLGILVKLIEKGVAMVDLAQVTCCLVAKSCLTLCNPMDCSLPSPSIHGISQARIWECVAIFSSRGSSQPRNQTCISCISRRVLYSEHTQNITCVPLVIQDCSQQREQCCAERKNKLKGNKA